MKKQLKAVSGEWQDLTDALARALDRMKESPGLDRRRLLVDIEYLVRDLDGLARTAFLSYMDRRRHKRTNT